MNIDILENGNLQIKFEPDDFTFIEDFASDNGDLFIFDLFEKYSCNGSYTLFDAGDANPYVGLTDAPCIAESMDILDGGQCVIVGKLWTLHNYMIFDWVGELKNGEPVIFSLVH